MGVVVAMCWLGEEFLNWFVFINVKWLVEWVVYFGGWIEFEECEDGGSNVVWYHGSGGGPGIDVVACFVNVIVFDFVVGQ